MKHTLSWLLSVCLTLCFFHSYAQKASFTVSVSGNCSPVTATFTNTSTGFSGGEKYQFNFGDGNGTINLFPSSHPYITEKTYDVVLIVTDNNQVYRDTEQLTVYKKPIVDFSSDVPNACVKTAVNFTSTSTAGDGTITNYLWDFGDGNTLDTNGTNVQNKYSSAKTFPVSLTVTNSYGCINTSASNSHSVTILPAPKVSFSASPTSLCNANDVVTFTNTTTGGALPTTYLWNFNDGAVSTDVNPSHSYGIKGQFGVRLLATSADGCSDTSKATLITVASSKSGITLPTLLCLDANLTFVDSSSPQTNTPVWLLDGTVVASDVHQYSTTFTDVNPHTLQLINDFGACSDTATKIIQAQATPVPAPFSVTIPGYCSLPANATFTDAGAGSTKWEWDFNNTVEANFNPTAFTKSATYSYTAENTYYVKLRVTDASGCTGELRQPVTIKKNKTTITSTKGIYGCQTLSTTFKATSTNPIAEYNWKFSDDNSVSILDTPQHIFVKYGNYTAFVKIKTTGGCEDTASIKVHIGDAPLFDFTPASDTVVCGNAKVLFKVVGDTNRLVGQYYWDYGDAGKYALTTTASNFTYPHQYLTDSVYTVSLVINNNGCTDTVTKTKYLTVLPPVPKIAPAIYSCDDRLKVVFKETSKGVRTYSWDFGDKTPTYDYDSTKVDTAIVHYFSKTGSYKVVLTTTNGACIAKDSLMYARVLDNQKPSLITIQSALCANDSLHTTVSGMANSPFGSGYRYTVKAIEYQNGLPFTGAYSVSALTPVNPFYVSITGLDLGNQNLRIITSSYSFNCPDTTNYIPVKVNGPNAGFFLTNTSLCLSDKVIFTDTSKADISSPIISWQWFFGDSASQTLTTGGNTSHKYDNPGNFDVKLVVSDAGNCSDTAYYSGNNLTVKGPKAQFRIEQNPILPNTPEVFTNLTDSGYSTRLNNSYSWSFGDGATSTSNADKINHSYKLYSDDTVVLVAKSSETGCSDTTSSIVHVKNTDLSFDTASSFINPNTTCPPVLVKFTNTSVNFDVVSWDFGDGLTADNINTPSHIYYKPGTYKVTIFGYYADNTYDSTWNYVTVSGPTAILHADVSIGCGSKQVMFSAETQNATSLIWDFGDGTTSPDSVVTHTYTTPNVYTPSLTVKNGGQCAFSYYLNTPVAIDSIHVSINKDSVIQCHQLLTNFTPEIFSIAKDAGQTLDYTWQFGTGTDSSKLDTTSFTYTKPGTYPVTFIATSPYGCTDTATTQITFADVPHATIQGPTEFCENTPQSFSAVKKNSSDVLTYNWLFQNGTSTLQNPPAQTFTAAWKDSIRLIVENNGCFDTVYYKPTIHSQPQVTIQISDSTVCSGTAIMFDAKPTISTQDVYTYQWNFGDGITSSDSVVSYQYVTTGVYSPSLFVKSTGLCSGTFYPVTKVVIDSLHISINKDSVIQCHQLLVNFKPAILSTAKNNGETLDYNWQFGDGVSSSKQDTTSFTYTKQGNYLATFIASSPFGCTDTAVTTIAYTDSTLATIQGSTEFCENTLQTFKAVKTNSTDVLTYNWQFQNGTSTSQNPPAQTFTASWKDSIRLIVDRNNCKDTIYQKLNIHGQPNVAIQLSDSIACLGTAIAFDAKPVTALSETVDYVWNFGGGNTANQPSASFTYSTIGTYPVSLLATSAFGCKEQVKDTVTIAPVPTASITALTDLCIGGTATFIGSSNVASSQYFWRFSDGTTSTQQNPAPKTYTTATTDNLYLVASIGGCHDTAYHSLTVHDLPLADVTPLIPRVCLGDSVQLTAHNGQTYQWLSATFITNTSVANPFVFPAVDTKYAVQVTDSYGCKNVDSIMVLVTQQQKISVVSPINVCIGNKASLSASGTDTYNWIDGTDLNLVTIANPTTKDSAKSRTYTVEGSDADGCFTDRATIEVIVRDKPVVDAGVDQTVPAGTPVQLSATSSGNILSWNWQPPLYLSCNNCAMPLSKPRGDTVYNVQATDNYGCKGSDTVRIRVVCKQSLVNVPQIFSPNGDGKNDLFRMTAIGVRTITHFVIYGRNGNKVYEKNNIGPLDKDASWDGMSNNNYMPTGTYIYIIQAVCDAGEVYNLQGTVTLIR